MCSKRILHDPSELQQHFRGGAGSVNSSIHNRKITAKQYFEKYICDRGTEQSDKIPWSQIEEWSRRCSFKCEICPNYVAKTTDAIKLHIKRLHKMTFTVYKGKYGEGKFKEVYHKCFDCQKFIKHDQGALRNHIEVWCSKLSLRSYYEKYITNAQNDTLVKNMLEASEDEKEACAEDKNISQVC